MERIELPERSMKDFLLHLLSKIKVKKPESRSFFSLFGDFKDILKMNNKVLELIADTNDKLSGDYIFDQHYIHATSQEICNLVEKMVFGLDNLVHHRYPNLHSVFLRIKEDIEDEFLLQKRKISTEFIIPYGRVTRDTADDVGGKNANLAELGNVLKLRTPEGFAITAAAYHAFIEYNGLLPFIERICSEWQSGKCSSAEASQQIRRQMRKAVLPKKLRRDLRTAMEKILTGPTDTMAFRSSAMGEDGSYSFAGQYTSEINISQKNAEQAYLNVLSSLYNESAMIYRHWKGFRESEVAMPVACQKMIDADISGVMYTHDPQAPERETMLIDASWGLGGLIVSGEIQTDQYVIKRKIPAENIVVNVARKERYLRPMSGGGTGEEAVEEARRNIPCLSNEKIALIAQAGLAIEQYFKKPQDIEFAIDQDGHSVILQTRPLMIRQYKSSRSVDLAHITRHYQAVIQSRGDVAQKGIALGPVYHVRQEKDLGTFPEGAILVAHYASPLFAKVLIKAAGIITDIGSATGHLATIAREFRVPTIVNCGVAMEKLTNGMEITMDAEENVIYAGLIHELQYYNLSQEPIEETYEYRLLRRVLKKIEPLNLLDPSEKNFVPGACKSLHDITRFVHEKAVEALIDFHFYNRHTSKAGAFKLDWNIPIDLMLIDIGGGIRKGAKRKIDVGEVMSAPMKAIMKGLALPGAWDNEPMSVDFGSFMSSLTRTISPELATPRNLGQNLAVVSADYANISLRLGYHFTMIDTYLSENINDNYIYFRFFGGVTDEIRRSRRARFLSRILAENDFRVERHGDFVIGRIKKLDNQGIMLRLNLLGLLIGYTRQLDVKMVDEKKITDNVKQFKTLGEGCYEQNQYTHS